MLRQFQLHDLHDLQVLVGHLGHQNLVAVLPGLQMLGLLRHLGEVLRLVLVLRLGVVDPCLGWKKMGCCPALVFRSMGSVLA